MTTLPEAERKRLWAKYSQRKTAKLNAGVPIENISEGELKREVGLPETEYWMESNFAP